MQDRPDSTALLDAVAQFLMTELLPTVDDKRLAFRVLIAANLATVVSSELRTEDARFFAELERLRALLPGVVEADPRTLPTRAERMEALERLNLALVEKVRRGAGTPAEQSAAFAHLKQTALETLAVANPRFDLSDDI